MNDYINSNKKVFSPIIISLIHIFLFLKTFYAQGPLIRPQYEVKVTLKLIQVYVTDKNGNPVPDLKRDDFIVYDNGIRQKITEFETHLIEFRTETREEIAETPVPSGYQLLPRQFFLFFDFAFNNPKGILKAKEAALYFLESQVRPIDKVGVLSFSVSGGLKLHEYLTDDHERIRRIIQEFGLKDIAGQAENFEAEYWALLRQENPVDATSSGYVFDPEEQRQQELEFLRRKRLESNFQVYYFVRKLTELAKAFRYIPGNKYVILFSSGVPYSFISGVPINYQLTIEGSKPKTASEDIRAGDFSGTVRRKPQSVEKSEQFETTVLSSLYEDMIKELTAANCTIYALDTYISSGKWNEDLLTRGAFSLQKMTSSTGGKYFGNINNYEKHVKDIQKITGSYYVLGYYVDDTWDGKYHQIKVEVNRPEVKVYAQKGYFNPKPFKEYTDFERLLHLVDLALSEKPLFQTPLHFPMKAILMPFSGKVNLSMWAEIEKEKIKDIAGRRVEAVAIAFDEKENIAQMERRQIDFSKLPDGPLYFCSFLSLTPGKYKCRLVIRNLESGSGAVASSSVTVDDYSPSTLKLYPPLFLKEEKEALFIHVGRRDAGFPFDSTRYSPIIEELEQGTKNFYAAIYCSHPDLSQPSINLVANLLRYQEETMVNVPISVNILESKPVGNGHIYLLEFQTEKLIPGEYLLYLFALDLATGAKAQISSLFRVK